MDRSTTNNMKISLATLPPEMLKRIASFLPQTGVLQLNQLCRNVRESLSLSSLSPNELFNSQQWIGTHGEFFGAPKFSGFYIPVMTPNAHSIRVTFGYRDQGYGNQKGYLYIMKRSSTGEPVTVCRSEKALHHDTKSSMTFNPHQDVEYELWYLVGGGGGHELTVTNFTIHTLIFDSQDKAFSHCYNILHSNNAIHQVSDFYLQMFLRISEDMLRHLADKNAIGPEDIGAGLYDFFSNFGFPVNQNSMLAIQEIMSAAINERRNRATRQSPDEVQMQLMRMARESESARARSYESIEVYDSDTSGDLMVQW